ncbi:MAG TPA: formylglycine-generating enzyme family protein [Vicinamibacterales bacterium]|nr:formylglycine-generating enzyme family protein [Vicinamibacterales bacterium]
MHSAWRCSRIVRRAAGGASALALVALAAVTVQAPLPPRPSLWTDPETGMQFVLIRPGSFRMGTPADEPQREAGEVPHTVRITRAFYLGRYEVTQGEWMSVMGENPAAFGDCGARCPVETVSWQAVKEFIHRLNEGSVRGFRLPTEAEWEFACRAGDSEAFGRSSTLSSREANIHGEFPYHAPKGTFRGRPVPVGYFQPSGWGLYDMAGNVWEWVEDAYCPYPDGPVSDPRGACGSPLKVIRGGSWAFNGASARCGLRYTHRPEDAGHSLGFRLAHD